MRRVLLCAVLLLVSACGAFAQITNTPTQDGMIYKPDGTYSIQFSLWKVLSGGVVQTDRVWSQTSSVLVHNARYTATLDFTRGLTSGSTYATAFAGPLWLQVQVGTDQPLQRHPYNIVLSAPDVNRMVYVSNAIYHMDGGVGDEKAAEAFYVLQAYQADPNANPDVILRFLATAQDRFDTLYRSFATPGTDRFLMRSFDNLANMLSILASLPGNANGSALINESVAFVTRAGNYLAGSTDDWLQTSNALGRSQASGGFEDYRNTQLVNLYNLAQTNSNAAKVVDIFFGPRFNASVTDTAQQILNNNTALRDSANFAPVATFIRPDGTFLVRHDQARALLTDFDNRMSSLANSNMAVLHTVDGMQLDYAGATLNPATVTQVQTMVRNQIVSVDIPMLQAGGAAAFAAPFTIAPDPTYTEYQIKSAQLKLSARVGQLTADYIETATAAFDIPPKLSTIASGEAKVVADTLDVSAAALDVNAAMGKYGKSDTEVIMDGVNRLSSQLNTVQQQLNERFDRLDANITTLYTTMNAQFASVNSTLQQINSTLNDVQVVVSSSQQTGLQTQAALDRLSQNIFAFAQWGGRQTLKTDLAIVDTDARNNIPIASSDFVNYYTVCRQFAIGDAVSSPSEVGPPLSTRSFDDLSVEQELTQGPANSNSPYNVEMNLNYILEYARRNYASPAGGTPFLPICPLLPNGVASIANPRSWEMSAIGLGRMCAYDPVNYAAVTANDLPKSSDGLYAVRQVGQNLQNTVANIALNPDNTKSPLFADLVLNQQLKANALDSALLAIENFQGGNLANAVSFVLAHWPANIAHSDTSALQNAAVALQGSKHLLDNFVAFGLSRSLQQSDLLSSLLYSQQRLPDADLVKALYANWTPGQPDPRLTFETYEMERNMALSTLLNNILNNIVANTTSLNRSGEPLASIDAMMKRLDYFASVRISGKVTPQAGSALIPGDPITLTFVGSSQTITVPAIPDASGNFTVSLPVYPVDNYILYAKADRFLRAKYPNLILVSEGNIPNTNPLSQNRNVIINIPLYAGELTGDNVINSADLIALRNAWFSTPSSPNWNPRADLNGDGVVNAADLALLKSNWGRVGD
jgi:hypothetical protein